MNIKWSVNISGIDVDSQPLITKYIINAKTKEDAEKLAREVHMMTHGVEFDLTVFAEPMKLTLRDEELILQIKAGLFSSLEERFSNITYKDFVRFFKDFEGFDAHLDYSSNEDSYFWFNFMRMKIKAVFSTDGRSYLDKSMIFYCSEHNHKVVALNNWTELYYYV